MKQVFFNSTRAYGIDAKLTILFVNKANELNLPTRL